jgi:regulator of ribonuclease activity A
MTDPAAPSPSGTADLFDAYGDALEICDLGLRQYGGRRTFQGRLVTLRCYGDNLILKDMLREPGHGRVLVVDAGGTTRGAMVGDNMAALAAENGWAGLVINGAVRDVAALARLPIGIKALAATPRRSRKDGHGDRDVVVSFGGGMFHPGRHLVSDEDGVVVLPDADRSAPPPLDPAGSLIQEDS